MKMKNTANRDTAWYGARTASLAEFMTPERNEVLRRTVAMRTRYMTVLAENMFHGQNAAALIRHCEAFGIQEMHTVETLCRFDPNPDIARGTDQWVDVRRHSSTAGALAALRRDGYRIVATTPRLSTSRAGRSHWSSAPSTPEYRTRSLPGPTNSCASRCAAWSKA